VQADASQGRENRCLSWTSALALRRARSIRSEDRAFKLPRTWVQRVTGHQAERSDWSGAKQQVVFASRDTAMSSVARRYQRRRDPVYDVAPTMPRGNRGVRIAPPGFAEGWIAEQLHERACERLRLRRGTSRPL